MARPIEALNRVFSGRKSAIMVRSNVDVTIVEDDTELIDVLDATETTKRFSVVYNNTATAITAGSGATAVTLGAKEGLLLVSPAQGRDGWLKINSKIGAIGKDENDNYVFDFMVPNANNIDFTNEATVDSWNAFGDVYSQKMPTIMDWNASCGAKLDLGASKAQHFLYDCMLNQRQIAVYFYAGIDFERDATGNILAGVPIINKKRATVWYGNAYISNFSVTASPETTADVSIDFAGNGELKALLEGEEVSTNWGELL